MYTPTTSHTLADRSPDRRIARPGSPRSLVSYGLALALSLAAPLASAQVPNWDDHETLDPRVEEAAEERVQDYFDDLVTGGAADDLLFNPPGFEDRIEEQIEEQITDEVIEQVTEAVEEETLETVTEEVENSVEQNVETVVEDIVEEAIEDSVAANVEDMVESDLEEAVALEMEAGLESDLEAGIEADLEGTVEEQVADNVEEQLESEIDEILEGIENDLEIDERRIHRDQWLVMGDPEVFEQLEKEGYLFDTVADLPGMGMRLAEVAAPASFDITEIRQGVIDVVGKDRAEIDLNHIYTAGTKDESPIAESVSPRSALPFPADTQAMGLRIGMVDSGVDTSHPALAKANIQAKSFVAPNANVPQFHGTAIASILVADDSEYQGLVPGAEVYAASVFEDDEERGEVASTFSLVRALDWLITSEVDVVNISLAGPPNRLLETALTRAHERGVMVVAAAGNGGPVADPLFPAAYDSVVAITAVDRTGTVYRLANRGEHLDLAAPGVAMLHAKAGGGYAASSGTSYAVPFAATAAARLRQLQPDADALSTMHESAKDLGAPGRDEIYGYGLLQPKDS